MNIYTDLAKNTVEIYLKTGKLPRTDTIAKDLLNKRAACFVSIHLKANDELRGCMGTILPVYKNLASEIIANAYEAAFRDPRFKPVEDSELDNLKFSVDILSEPEAIPSKNKLDPKKYGVIVKSLDGRSGLLLPDLPTIETPEQQLDIAKEKAGILSDEKVLLYRFTVKRYGDD